MDARKTRGTIMKMVVDRTHGIVINIGKEDVRLTRIKENVAFTVKVKADKKDVIEKWLCMHTHLHSYEKIANNLNKVLDTSISAKPQFKRTYETKYSINGIVKRVSKCGKYYNSTMMGIKLANGYADSIAIESDKYRIEIGSDMEFKLYEQVTNQLVFRFPIAIDMDDQNQMVLKLFNEDCLNYLKKSSCLKLSKITDSAKRSLIIDVYTSYSESVMNQMIETCIKYDKLALVMTDKPTPIIGSLPNILLVYRGSNKIVMWAYDDNGVQMKRIDFDKN